MAQASTKGSGIKHPYHLVDPSPWPLIGAISALILALGALTYMHPEMFGTSIINPKSRIPCA